ncbi:hypothetical protein LCGC14_2679470, partial [marine sediment metagenome]
RELQITASPSQQWYQSPRAAVPESIERLRRRSRSGVLPLVPHWQPCYTGTDKVPMGKQMVDGEKLRDYRIRLNKVELELLVWALDTAKEATKNDKSAPHETLQISSLRMRLNRPGSARRWWRGGWVLNDRVQVWMSELRHAAPQVWRPPGRPQRRRDVSALPRVPAGSARADRAEAFGEIAHCCVGFIHPRRFSASNGEGLSTWKDRGNVKNKTENNSNSIYWWSLCFYFW